MRWRPAPTDKRTTMNDHRRFPGCKLRLVCTACGGAKAYDPERVIDRLQALRAGGHQTRLIEVARRARPCPTCRRQAWQADFAWPPEITESEVKRLANRYRS